MRPIILPTILYAIWMRVDFAENGNSETTEKKFDETPPFMLTDFLEKYEIEYNDVNPKPVDHKIRESRPTSSIVYDTDSSYSGNATSGKGKKHRRRRAKNEAYGEETRETPTDESPKQSTRRADFKMGDNNTLSRGKETEDQKLEKRYSRVKIVANSRDRREKTDKAKTRSREGRRKADDLEKKSTSSREGSQKTEHLSRKCSSRERPRISRHARHRSVTPKRNRKPETLSRKSSDSDIEKVKLVFGESATFKHIQPRSEETSATERKNLNSSSSSAERRRKLDENQKRLRRVKGKSPKAVILDEDSEGFVRSKHVTHVKRNEKTALVSFETESTHFRKPKKSFPRRFEYLPDDADDIAQRLQKQCSTSLYRLSPQPSPTREELLEYAKIAEREKNNCVTLFKDAIKNILGKPESKNYFTDKEKIEELYKDLKKPSKRNDNIPFCKNLSCKSIREYWRKLCANLFMHLYFQHKPMKPSHKRIEDHEIKCENKRLTLKYHPDIEYLTQEVLACPTAVDETNKRKWLYISAGSDEKSYFVYSQSKQNVIHLSAHLQY